MNRKVTQEELHRIHKRRGIKGECYEDAKDLSKTIKKGLARKDPIKCGFHSIELANDNRKEVSDLWQDTQEGNKDLCIEVQGQTYNISIIFDQQNERAILKSVDKDPQLLANIAERFPHTYINRVRFYLDFYCKDYVDATHLFYFLRKYMYFPYCKKTSMKGGKFRGFEEQKELKRSINAVYNLWRNENKKRKIAVVYERGPKDRIKREYKKRPPKWDIRDVDRVRVVFFKGTAPNDKVNLKSIISSPFYYLTEKKQIFRLKIFKDKEGGKVCQYLPQEYDYNYYAEDEDGNSESFQEEFLKAKTIIPQVFSDIHEVTAEIKDAELFNWLKEMVQEAIDAADKTWYQTIQH